MKPNFQGFSEYENPFSNETPESLVTEQEHPAFDRNVDQYLYQNSPFADLEQSEFTVPVEETYQDNEQQQWQGFQDEDDETNSHGHLEMTDDEMELSFEHDDQELEFGEFENVELIIPKRNPIDPVPGTTIYVNINIGKSNYPLNFTGIFCPVAFDPTQPTDVVLYLHGMTHAFPGSDARMDMYWKSVSTKYNYDLRLREEINASNRNVVFVAPSLGKSPNAYRNQLSGNANGLDRYLKQVRDAVDKYIVQKNHNIAFSDFQRVFLCAHSAGGHQMLLIASASNPVYGSRITECWGFDSLYGGMTRWLTWAEKNPDKKLLILYLSSTAKNADNLARRAKNLPNIAVIKSTAKNHYMVPKHHLKDILVASAPSSVANEYTSEQYSWEAEGYQEAVLPDEFDKELLTYETPLEDALQLRDINFFTTQDKKILVDQLNAGNKTAHGLTSEIFYARNPSRNRRPLAARDPQLSQYKSILAHVKTVLRRYVFDVDKFSPPATTPYPRPASWIQFKQRAVQIAKDELEKWKPAGLKEYDVEGFKMVLGYWINSGVEQLKNLKKIPSTRAWSAAFISYVMKMAGPSDFPASPGHTGYVRYAKNNRNPNSPFQLVDIQEAGIGNQFASSKRIEVGDLVCRARFDLEEKDIQYASTFNAIEKYNHCDIIIEIVEGNNPHLIVIGGNVNDDVSAKKIKIDPQSRKVTLSSTAKKDSKGNAYDFFAILKIRTDIGVNGGTVVSPATTANTGNTGHRYPSNTSGSTPSSESTWQKAIRLNERYGNELRWNSRIYEINDFLLPFSGYQNVSLGPEAFAKAVATWQRSQGFPEDACDGVIGPNTWKKLEAQLNQKSTSSGVADGAIQTKVASNMTGRWGTLTINTTIPALSKSHPTYQFTDDDALWLARFVEGEAGGRNNADSHAVVWAMFNRFGILRHRVAAWKNFAVFLQKYSTTLQPLLNSVGAAERVWHNHKSNPQKFPIVDSTDTYKKKDSSGKFIDTGIRKVQYVKHIKLQQKPWKSFNEETRSMITAILNGQLPNPGIGVATEFASTMVYLKTARRKKGIKQSPTLDDWKKYTIDYANKNELIWIGEKVNLDQTKNAFFIQRRLKDVPPSAVVIKSASSIQSFEDGDFEVPELELDDEVTAALESIGDDESYEASYHAEAGESEIEESYY